GQIPRPWRQRRGRIGPTVSDQLGALSTGLPAAPASTGQDLSGLVEPPPKATQADAGSDAQALLTTMSLHTRKTRRTLATARAPPPWSGFARNVAAGEKRSALTTHSTSLLASSQSRSAQIVFLNQPWSVPAIRQLSLDTCSGGRDS